MGPIGREEREAVLDEDGADQRHVRQVGPAPIGVVQEDDVVGFEVRKGLQGGPDRQGHRPEVDRDVGGLGDEAAVGIEDGAGEVPPLLDVRRVGTPFQDGAHLFGDGRQHVPEDFQTDGVDPCARHPIPP